MFRPLKLKVTSTYEYVQVTPEVIGDLYDRGLLDTTLSKEEKIAYVLEHPTKPIKMCRGVSIFLNHFLVIQNDLTDLITGLISFETKEDMLEFFDELPE